MQKLGILVVYIRSGKNKAFLDQFSPVNAEQEKTLQVILDLVHQQFIDKVKKGRGKRLHIDSGNIFRLVLDGYSGQVTRLN